MAAPEPTRALVTGGAGFIGSNVVDALLDAGHDVAILDDLSTGRRVNIAPALERGARLHEVDVRDPAATSDVITGERPALVFHLAAQIDVRKSVDDPAFDARVNVEGTINVLEAAREAGVRRVVYSSTGGALYGEADEIPTPESAPIRPQSPYGQSKFAADGYCALAERLHGQSVVSLRYGNIYGPRQDPLGEAGVVAIFCQRVRDGLPLTVYGDGTQTRDYVYVGDVVGANLAAAASDVPGAFNIGQGIETSVLDLVAALGEIAGTRLEVEHAPPRAGEVLRSCVDPSAIERALGWRPSVGLVDGLRRTLAYEEAVSAGA